MSRSDNSEGEIDIPDFLTSKIDEQVNELAIFQFSVNCKPGVADSLSRFPKSSQDLKEYGKICLRKEVRAIFDGNLNQTNREET